MAASVPETVTVVSRDGTVLTASVSSSQKADSSERRQVIVVDAVPIRRRSVDLRQRLAHALKVLERQARDADISFSLISAPTMSSVFVDDTKIVWAVTALVGNSLRYVRHGTRHRPGGSIAVELRLDEAERELSITASDDGPGMPQNAAEILRGEAVSDGNAPVLALIHDVVSAQGGRVDVTSSQDMIEHGTTVTICLPIAPPT